MDFINHFVNQLSFVDFTICSTLILVTYLLEYLIVQYNSFIIKNDNNIISIISRNYLLLSIIGFIVITIISFMLTSILLLIFGEIIYILILHIIFLLKFRSKFVNFREIITHPINFFFFNIFSVLYNILLYFLIIFLIVPNNSEAGYFIYSIFIFSRILPIVLQIRLFYKAFQRKKQSKDVYASFTNPKNILIRATSSFIYTLTSIMVVIFSFIAAIKYNTEYEKVILADQNINNVRKNIKDFDNNLNDLSNTMNYLNLIQKDTQNKLDSLQALLLLINNDIDEISIKKNRLEVKIENLKIKSEEDIKKDAIYLALKDILGEHSIAVYIFSFLIGVLASVSANYITKIKLFDQRTEDDQVVKRRKDR